MKISLLILICFASGYNIVNGQTREQEFLKLKEGIDKTYYTFDDQALKDLLKSTLKIHSKYPDSYYPPYYAGILCLQMGKIYYLPKPEKAYEYFDKSIDYFLKAKEIKKTAELYALISSAYGKKSALTTIKSIYFGLKAKDYIYDAAELDSSNTKVYLIAATHLMHTPESFGGDKKWAEKLLKKALKINNKKNIDDNFAVNWAGDAEVYAYLAQLEILRNNKEKAKYFINKSLAIIPDYGFILNDLIPQMESLGK